MINNIIVSVLYLFGITDAPVTVGDYLWDVIVLVVGLYIVKYCMVFITSLFSDMLKIH